MAHCNGTDIWVITHGWDSDAFYAYLVTQNGIDPPIISNIGSTHTGNTLNTIGYLKPSLNGKMIASAAGFADGDNLELFDFDNKTGAFSNPISISSGRGAYGIAFSPDNTKLYVSYSDFTNDKIVQYDLRADGGNQDSIIESRTVIHNSLYPYGAT